MIITNVHRKQNIGIIVYSHYSRDARVRRYAESLSRKGFKVTVICLNEDYIPREENITLVKYLIPRRRFGRFWYTLEYLLFFVFSFFTLTITVFTKKYGLIHVNNMPDILVFAAIVPKLLGTKVVLDIHDPMPELYMSKYHAEENDFMLKWLKWLENVSLSFADCVITANEAFKSILLRRLNRKIDVILNCPDPRIFKSANNQQLITRNQNFTLLYMGTVERRFGLDIAIEAMPNLVKQIPNLRFIIIPKLEEEGKYLKSLKFKIQNSKLENCVQILDPQPLEKIAQMLKKTDVGVVLAKNGIFTESIFPVKLLEFVQMNVPVIATRTKLLSTYFKNDQIYFLRKNTSSEFANAVIDLYGDKRLRQSLSQRAKQYLKEYNWEREEKKYLEIIDSLSGHNSETFTPK